MADETENTEIEETPEEPVAAVEETEVEAPAAEADPEPEVDAPAAEADPEPEVEEPVAEAAPEPEVAEDEVAPEPEVDPEPEAAPAEPEPAAAEVEVEPADEATDEPAADVAEPAPDETSVEAAPAAVSGPKPKRKHVPRSERPKKTRPQRVPSAERKSITRLPKPEHERGRRQERQGTVVSAASDKTIVVRVDTVKVHPRYKKVIKRSTRLHAHDEENQAKLGDVVRIVETRPLSRMKRWRLQEIVEVAK